MTEQDLHDMLRATIGQVQNAWKSTSSPVLVMVIVGGCSRDFSGGGGFWVGLAKQEKWWEHPGKHKTYEVEGEEEEEGRVVAGEMSMSHV